MEKLTMREKVLLLVLALTVILVGGFTLLVFPLMENNEVLAETVAELQSERMIMETTIAQNPKFLKEIKNTEEELSDSLNLISDPVKTEWIDINLNNYAKNNRLEILEIDYQKANTGLAEVNYHESDIEYELKEEILKLNESNGSEDENKHSDYEIIKHPMKLVVAGTVNQVSSFITDLYGETETIYIRNLNYDYNEQKCEINLDVYSIDKINLQNKKPHFIGKYGVKGSKSK